MKNDNFNILKAKINFTLFFTLVLTITALSSCITSFPVEGTVVDCNGQMVIPIKNPTKRAMFNGGQQAMDKFSNFLRRLK